MSFAKYIIAGAALSGALLLDVASARADHCGGNDTNDFSYMGTTCRFQRWTDGWKYNHDMVVTDEHDPFLVLERTTNANNCGNTGAQTFKTNAKTTDTDTASFSVGVSLTNTVKGEIGSDLAGKLSISVEAGFTAGTQTTSTVIREIGDEISTVVDGCSKVRIHVRVTGFHNAAVSGTVSQQHWYRIHCDNSAYTTNWYVCDTKTQSFTGSSGTACVTKAYVDSDTTGLECTDAELAPGCKPDAGVDAAVDAGAPDAGGYDSGYPSPDAGYPSPDAGYPYPDAGSYPDACWYCDASYPDAGTPYLDAYPYDPEAGSY